VLTAIYLFYIPGRDLRTVPALVIVAHLAGKANRMDRGWRGLLLVAACMPSVYLLGIPM